MNKRVLSAFLAAFILAASPVSLEAADYRIDPGHSFVQFKISHIGFSWMIGTFDRLSGSFTYDPSGESAGQTVAVEIDTASIDTGHAERDKHLRSSDFLDVERFPTATFASTSYEGGPEGGTMMGDLTLMGVTRPIAISVGKVGEGDDPWGGYRAGFEGTVTIHRSDFGAGMSLGPASESMELSLFIEGVRM